MSKYLSDGLVNYNPRYQDFGAKKFNNNVKNGSNIKKGFGLVKNIACDSGNKLCEWGWLPQSWCEKINFGCKLASAIEENWG